MRESWERMRQHFQESSAVMERLADACGEEIVALAEMMAATFRDGHKILLCGNGGSAADCQHVAAELVGRLTGDFTRPGLPAIALTTDTSFLTAFANDYSFDDVFARQVQALGVPQDLLIAISTSGASRNVLRAVQEATSQGMRTAALMGREGDVASRVNLAVRVPSANTQAIQEAHLAIEHLVCDLCERGVFGERGREAEQEALSL